MIASILAVVRIMTSSRLNWGGGGGVSAQFKKNRKDLFQLTGTEGHI